RMDANLTSKHHLEFIWNYQNFQAKQDFLNNVDPAFPPPVPQIAGVQDSHRFSLTAALRSQLTATVVNEARFGLNGGTVLFFAVGPGSFTPFGGIEPQFGSSASLAASQIFGTNLGLTNPYNPDGTERRNTPIKQINDNVSWTRGKHNFNFGGSFTHVNSWIEDAGFPDVPQVFFGVPNTDPAATMFSSANFPGASASQIANAATLYALLSGRVSEVDFQSFLDEKKKVFTLTSPQVQRNYQSEFGFYFQDFFKVRPNLTL